MTETISHELTITLEGDPADMRSAVIGAACEVGRRCGGAFVFGSMVIHNVPDEDCPEGEPHTARLTWQTNPPARPAAPDGGRR